MSESPQGQQVMNPAALTVADVARILGVPVEAVERDIAEGAPRAADGTMNLVHYAAWLLAGLAEGQQAEAADGD